MARASTPDRAHASLGRHLEAQDTRIHRDAHQPVDYIRCHRFQQKGKLDEVD